jgi:ABC-type Zn uptake system ZnuABC Zn-binding protein ZnuA
LSPTLEHNHSISRREFTRESVLAMLAGVVITITGCSDSPSAPSQGGSGGGGSTTGDVSGVVSANHGHIAMVTAAQITAAGAVSLDIMGQATHPHTVSLTASQVQQIGSRQQVVVTSTTNESHLHTVTFN